MRRAELKVVNIHANLLTTGDRNVPNAPCGVESLRKELKFLFYLPAVGGSLCKGGVVDAKQFL